MALISRDYPHFKDEEAEIKSSVRVDRANRRCSWRRPKPDDSKVHALYHSVMLPIATGPCLAPGGSPGCFPKEQS